MLATLVVYNVKLCLFWEINYIRYISVQAYENTETSAKEWEDEKHCNLTFRNPASYI
jgi:hypothetical protein